jgi:predicted HicB family RNase H-like nuclease
MQLIQLENKDLEEAIANLKDAQKGWLETALELGRNILEPLSDDFSGQLRVRMPKSLHRVLTEVYIKSKNQPLGDQIFKKLKIKLPKNISKSEEINEGFKIKKSKQYIPLL